MAVYAREFSVEKKADKSPLTEADKSAHHTLHVVGKPDANTPWRVLGSRSHPSPDLDDWLKQLGEHDMLPMGSSLKLCVIAEGKADVYPRLAPTCLWDTGAAQAVVEQAGGRVETLQGEPLSYATPSEKLNPHFVVWGHRNPNES
ncbi:3'(2'),5'-bisphosphate nucleotidase CysQ family protein [Vreelandella salicampi]|uniref:3'(2'),5'-bisphosphate nucleotidase CysQ n=1 Tax=Vreelandella salicampi TaxID=1449798 RepID=A0A7Z0LIW2_9GAMM|nr:inositol monophosphatase family protein [Halomonas salicampi]NYS59733.1 hypothetical protein [Halomonas salicampi]